MGLVSRIIFYLFVVIVSILVGLESEAHWIVIFSFTFFILLISVEVADYWEYRVPDLLKTLLLWLSIFIGVLSIFLIFYDNYGMFEAFVAFSLSVIIIILVKIYIKKIK